MESSAIEARSLSNLTALASNPPLYPRNPTHVRHDPLILYIARVPGSRDVFLTPMKPRDKVVSAEDIQSSFYFVHVDQPEDARLIDSHEPNYPQSRVSSNAPSAPTVSRKAVPGAPATPSLSLRKPVPGTLAPVSNYDSIRNVNAGNYAQKSIAQDSIQRRSFDSTPPRLENVRPNAPPFRRSFESQQSVGASLTLIRRDPATGVQWNVGRIEDPPVLDVSSSSLNDPVAKRKAGGPMFLEIFNPGYSKFLQSENAARTSLPNRSTTLSSQIGSTSQQNRNDAPPQPYETTFRRRLWLEGSQYTNGNFGHRKKSSHDYNSRLPSSRDGYGAHGSPLPAFLSHNDKSYNTIQVSDKQTSFRGYVFTSPWNGRCEFVTGGGGGSLKCRHIIPGLQGAQATAMPISELRFNLPGSSRTAAPKGEESPKRRLIFQKDRHRKLSNSLNEKNRHPDDRLDLSLGQESAGGGFGGKQAKLGKIILEDEGLKMMDLLVAANLSLWWRAYEKADNTSRGDRSSFF